MNMGELFRNKSPWAETAKQATFYLTALLGVAIVCMSATFIWFDIKTSYLAWGVPISQYVNLPESDLLAWILSILVSLVQIFGRGLKFSGQESGKHPMVRALLIITTLGDGMMDFMQLSYEQANIIPSLIVVVVVYSLISEHLLVFSVGTTWPMVKRILEDIDETYGSYDNASASAPAQGIPPIKAYSPRPSKNPVAQAPAWSGPVNHSRSRRNRRDKRDGRDKRAPANRERSLDSTEFFIRRD